MVAGLRQRGGDCRRQPQRHRQVPPINVGGHGPSMVEYLLEKSIYNWLDMQEAFTKNFEGTYKRPCTIRDLQRCVQEKDETSRAYLSHWLDMKNSCAGVHAQTAMAAFIDGLERGTLLQHKLKRLQDNHQLDLNQMIQLASEFAAADDDARGSLPAKAVPTQARRNISTKRKTAPEEKQPTDMVAMTFAGRGDGGQRGRGMGAGRGQQRGSATNSAPLRVPQTY